jgi:hypothetical protein
MNTSWFLLVKTFLKSSLDNYILPGTLTGTEILWLYMIQWKRDLATLVFASFFLSSQQLKSIDLSSALQRKEIDGTQGETA